MRQQQTSSGSASRPPAPTSPWRAAVWVGLQPRRRRVGNRVQRSRELRRHGDLREAPDDELHERAHGPRQRQQPEAGRAVRRRVRDPGACASFFDNLPPMACTPIGPRAAGATCTFNGQCMSGSCNGTKDSVCGTCGSPPAIGDDCRDSTCAEGDRCLAATDTCAAVVGSNGTCDATHPCDRGYSCVGENAKTMTSGTCETGVHQRRRLLRRRRCRVAIRRSASTAAARPAPRPASGSSIPATTAPSPPTAAWWPTTAAAATARRRPADTRRDRLRPAGRRHARRLRRRRLLHGDRRGRRRRPRDVQAVRERQRTPATPSSGPAAWPRRAAWSRAAATAARRGRASSPSPRCAPRRTRRPAAELARPARRDHLRR